MHPLTHSLCQNLPGRPPTDAVQSILDNRVQDVLRARHLQRQRIKPRARCSKRSGSEALVRDVATICKSELRAHVGQALPNNAVRALQRLRLRPVFQPRLVDVRMKLVSKRDATVTKRHERKTSLLNLRSCSRPRQRDDSFHCSENLDAALWRSIVGKIAELDSALTLA